MIVTTRVALILLLLGSVLPIRAQEPVEPRPVGTPSASTLPPPSRTGLRLARSEDGLHFTDSGKVFLRHAASPDLVLLPNGDLLALFDYVERQTSTKPTTMAVTRSRDGGRSWSPMRPIRLALRSASRGAVGRISNPRHGSLVLVPGGGFRLYFTADVKAGGSRNRSGREPTTGIVAATSVDGVHYRIDRHARVPLVAAAPHTSVTAARIGQRIHLYIGADGNPANTTHSRLAHHLVSRRGARFIPIRMSHTPDVWFSGSIAGVPGQLRAYVSAGRSVVSMTSRDGRDWQSEPGVRLEGGWDPAVARLRDGTYLMVYCARLSAESDESVQLVDATPEVDAWDEASDTTEVDAADPEVLSDPDALAQADADDESKVHTETDLPVNDAEAIEADTAVAQTSTDGTAEMPSSVEGDVDALSPDSADPSNEVTSSDQTTPEHDSAAATEVEADADWRDTWDPVASDGFPPVPDFKNWVDYVAWYTEYQAVVPPINAFDAYMEFMPDPVYDPEGDAEWPNFNGMYGLDRDIGPPAPWDPAEHPDWEASDRSNRDLFEKFADAARIEEYALPAEFPEEVVERRPDGEVLLLELRLPHLSKHRALTKALLAGAWRKGEGGKVSPRRMIDTLETTLRAASHMQQGNTLIEDLVGIAERALIQKNARWALRHGVFGGKDLEEAFHTLRNYDLPDPNPGRHLRGEHAFSMQTTQYLFPPTGPGGEPQLDLERARSVVDETWLGDDDFDFDRISRMGPADARASVNAFDSAYRELSDKMRVGYPQFRTADFDAVHEKYVHTTPLTEAFMPNLSRYYQLRTREQASSRATQLAYATHLFKAKHGRFPESLAELPSDYGEQMRIDPFTGDYFGYRVTDDGPMIYSASENARDDGGLHAPRWGDKVENDTDSDDYVFYPPQP